MVWLLLMVLRGRCCRSGGAVWADSAGMQMSAVPTTMIMVSAKSAGVLIVVVPAITVCPAGMRESRNAHRERERQD